MAGYSPASTVTSNLPQSTVRYYDKDFYDNLKAEAPWLRCIERRMLPEKSGNQHFLFMYQTFGANVAQQSEGTVGSGITPTVNQTSAVIGQYADYINFSDLVLETTIDPALENLERELAYRLSLSLNTITKTTADGANSVDAKVAVTTTATQLMTFPTLTAGVQSLRGQNVLPFDRAAGRFVLIVHPFIVGDIKNDPANNSLTDIYKRTSTGFDRLTELPGEDGDVQYLDFGGIRAYESTIVTSTANFLSSGNTALRTYMFGYQALTGISLGVKENAQIGEGDWSNMRLWINKWDTPSPSDPSRVIGGSTAYNVKYTTTLPPDTTMRMRYWDTVSGIA